MPLPLSLFPQAALSLRSWPPPERHSASHVWWGEASSYSRSPLRAEHSEGDQEGRKCCSSPRAQDNVASSAFYQAAKNSQGLESLLKASPGSRLRLVFHRPQVALAGEDAQDLSHPQPGSLVLSHVRKAVGSAGQPLAHSVYHTLGAESSPGW